MEKTDIIEAFWDIDRLLDSPIELTICGGAAGILFHGINRATIDIDVLISNPKLSDHIQNIVGLSKSKGWDENWLNDSAKGFVDFLPDGFLERREKR